MMDFSVSVTAAEKRRLEEFLGVLRKKCEPQLNPNSVYINEEFESEFRSKLLIHHCFIGSPLFQQSFDSAFIAACRHAGFKVEEAPDGQRFWDVVIDGRRISLKSSKAKNLSKDFLHISKLTEAAWIQDCRTAKMRQSYTRDLFKKYCDEVDAIIQFRYFIKRQKYELVEVPVQLFSQIQEVETKYFNADGPTINIPVGKEPPDFTLKIDRSDSKVTLAKINKKLCVVHGSWQL